VNGRSEAWKGEVEVDVLIDMWGGGCQLRAVNSAVKSTEMDTGEKKKKETRNQNDEAYVQRILN
jgi:hypothetical protein